MCMVHIPGVIDLYDPFMKVRHCTGPLNSDGRLSNFAHFENCTFTGNTAEEFGAAIGFTSFLEFQNVQNIRPFEIEGW